MTHQTSPLPKSVTEESVVAVQHWTDQLFSIRLSRPASFRFRSGEFVMLGLQIDGKPLLRAYSIASPAWDEELDFYSIKVQDGPLTSRLQNIVPGDRVLLGRKPTGTLVLDALLPGRRLFMLSTGTGVAPFASLLRDPETYEKFDSVILTETCRKVSDLAYGAQMVASLRDDPLVGETAPDKLCHYQSATREDFRHTGRITDLITSNRIFDDLDISHFDPEVDRIMICGSMEMIADTRRIVESAGFIEGSNAAPGGFVVEKAFAG